MGSESEIEKIISAGRVVMSGSPGTLMKSMRREVGITQSQLARQLKVNRSTVAEYESNIRKSPGCFVVKRWIDAVSEIKSAKRCEF